MALGRPTIFYPKDPNGPRLHSAGFTARGRQLFERARKSLQKLAKWPGHVSDTDVIEALVRGESETKRYLRERK